MLNIVATARRQPTTPRRKNDRFRHGVDESTSFDSSDFPAIFLILRMSFRVLWATCIGVSSNCCATFSDVESVLWRMAAETAHGTRTLERIPLFVQWKPSSVRKKRAHLFLMYRQFMPFMHSGGKILLQNLSTGSIARRNFLVKQTRRSLSTLFYPFRQSESAVRRTDCITNPQHDVRILDTIDKKKRATAGVL